MDAQSSLENILSPAEMNIDELEKLCIKYRALQENAKRKGHVIEAVPNLMSQTKLNEITAIVGNDSTNQAQSINSIGKQYTNDLKDNLEDLLRNLDNTVELYKDYADKLKFQLVELTTVEKTETIQNSFELRNNAVHGDLVKKWQNHIILNVQAIFIYQKLLNDFYHDILVKNIGQGNADNLRSPCALYNAHKERSATSGEVSPIPCPHWYTDPLGYLQCLWE